jgi:prevent-host-death family protein
MHRMTTYELELAGFPVVEEASDAVFEAVSGGQPVLLVRRGKPAAVVLDYESWQEVEELARGGDGVEW